jgi:hypothetical protein
MNTQGKRRYRVAAGLATGLLGLLAPLFGRPAPWRVERMEEKYIFKNDSRTPILPPVVEGKRLTCADRPDRAEVQRRGLPALPDTMPFFEVRREILRMESKKVVDRIDAPRFYPLIGPARLHHLRWKCKAQLAVTLHLHWPWEGTCGWRGEQVVLFDADHLHLAPPPDPTAVRPPGARALPGKP